jgi:rhamnosyltransferase
MSHNGAVWIVLATFNGGEFLGEQLASLFRQTWSDWRLLVRDDGSTDVTRSQLEGARSGDSRIEILDDQIGRLGPARSFGRLLSEAAARGAGVVFCCDQDDVWHPDKLTRQLAAIDRVELETGPDTPVLVYSDARLVDRSGLSLGTTFARKVVAAMPEEADPLPSCLLGNRVPGCTLAINRALLELAVPQPDDTPMHDWWLAALAAAAGRTVWLPEPLVDYRQHGDNSVGAPGWMTRARTALLRWRTGDARSSLMAAPGQARRLIERLGERHHSARIGLIEEFLAALDRPSGAARGEKLYRWMQAATEQGARFSVAEIGKIAALTWSQQRGPQRRPTVREDRRADA